MGTLENSYWPATLDFPLRDSTCGGALLEMARATPNAIALTEAVADRSDRRKWTYGELHAQAAQMARYLASRYERRSHIAVWGANRPEWVIAQFAIALADMVMVTVNPAYTDRECEYVLRQSTARAVFYQRQYRSHNLETTLLSLAEQGVIEKKHCVEFGDILNCRADTSNCELPNVDPFAPAMIQYTSGTTGAAKGAVLTHYNVSNNSRMMALIKGQDASTVNLAIPPLFHTGGCVGGVLATVQTGGTLLLPENFDAGFMLDLIEQEKATYMFGVPTMLIGMLEEQSRTPRDVSSLKTIFSGGTVVPVDIVKRAEREFEATLVIGYGMTESSPAITHTRLKDSAEDKSETIGYPIPQIDVKIVDSDSGEIAPINAPGELCTRGFHVMAGYFDMPDATSAAIDEDGWLHTGDLCTMDSRGYCRIVGRLKDMIIRGGENIYPREIEEIFYKHPLVSEIAVFGVSDDYFGEAVAAAVIAAPEMQIQMNDLQAYGVKHLAKHKLPSRWYVLTELPMTLSGKVRKVELRERCEHEDLEPFRIM